MQMSFKNITQREFSFKIYSEIHDNRQYGIERIL